MPQWAGAGGRGRKAARLRGRDDRDGRYHCHTGSWRESVTALKQSHARPARLPRHRSESPAPQNPAGAAFRRRRRPAAAMCAASQQRIPRLCQDRRPAGGPRTSRRLGVGGGVEQAGVRCRPRGTARASAPIHGQAGRGTASTPARARARWPRCSAARGSVGGRGGEGAAHVSALATAPALRLLRTRMRSSMSCGGGGGASGAGARSQREPPARARGIRWE